MSDKPKKKRVLRSAVVDRTEQLGPSMVRVHLRGDDIAAIPQPEVTDGYVKLLFPPPGADYSWPFDPEELRETLPREQWPVTRTYTIRSIDTAAGTMAVDFVVHGTAGLAGPWAAGARPGDEIGFFGPGGAWAPSAEADEHLLVGDEAAIPAIAAALDALPATTHATVWAEVADADSHLPLATGPNIDVHWVHRDGEPYGVPLARAVREAGLPEARTLRAFVHGNAEMIKGLRKFLFVDNGLPRDQVSISGYWRTGQDEDAWQAGKREFVQQMEAEQDGAAAG